MVINIPINVDEELLNKVIKDEFESKTYEYLYSQIDKTLKSKDPSYYAQTVKGGVEQMVKEIVAAEILTTWRDSIVEQAAALLEARVSKTKAAKQLKE